MANRCVSLDATWAHLPAPPPPHHTWLSPAAAAGFADDALTAALWASMAPSAASYCGSAASPTPSTSTTTTTSSAASAEILAGGGARGQARARAAATRPSGRVSKRKPRPSRRAHTTYISADPADFRRMVQEITGFPVPGAHTAYASASSTPSHPHAAAALACVLPTLDTSAFLLDRASPPPPPPQPKQKSKNTTVVSPATTMASTPPPAAAAAHEAPPSSQLLQELEEMISAPAFPTLESWGMI